MAAAAILNLLPVWILFYKTVFWYWL